jgi:hypothetical protein
MVVVDFGGQPVTRLMLPMKDADRLSKLIADKVLELLGKDSGAQGSAQARGEGK